MLAARTRGLLAPAHEFVRRPVSLLAHSTAIVDRFTAHATSHILVCDALSEMCSSPTHRTHTSARTHTHSHARTHTHHIPTYAMPLHTHTMPKRPVCTYRSQPPRHTPHTQGPEGSLPLACPASTSRVPPARRECTRGCARTRSTRISASKRLKNTATPNLGPHHVKHRNKAPNVATHTGSEFTTAAHIGAVAAWRVRAVSRQHRHSRATH